MKKENVKRPISQSEAWELSKKYKWVLVREMSRIDLGLTDKVAINHEELLEARFFDEKSEVRIFGDQAALISDPKDGLSSMNVVDKSFELAHGGQFGKEIVVREYLDYDDDGQLFVLASRLKCWEE